MDNTDQNQDKPIESYSTESTLQFEPKFTFWSGVSVALALIGGQLLAGIIGAIIAGVTVGMEADNFMGITGGISLVIGFPLAVWIVLRRRRLEVSAWNWNSKYWVLIPVSFLMVFCTSYIIGTLIEFLPNYKEMMAQYSDTFSQFNPILLFIGGVVIGPVCEEIIFRGIILKEFLKSYDYKKAILLAAIIFSVIHMIPIQMISTFFIGLVLGFLYYKTRSLWLVTIIHVANNLLAFTVGIGDLETDESTRAYFGNDILFFGSWILAGIGIYISYVLFEKFHGSAVNEEKVV